MKIKGSILYIDNDAIILSLFSHILVRKGYEVYSVSSIKEAKQVLSQHTVHLIITDLRLSDDTSSDDVSGIFLAQTVAPTIPKIIMTGYASLNIVRQALMAREDQVLPAAIDFIDKSEGPDVLLEAVDAAFAQYVKLDRPQFQVGGALTDAHSASYITRLAEKRVLEQLQQMNYVLIIEPRQQGKTSLINYLFRCPDLPDTVMLYVDLSSLDNSSQARWHYNLHQRLSSQLSRSFSDTPSLACPTSHSEWRQYVEQLTAFFEQRGRKVVIALDEVGTSVPDLTIFFNVLRDVFNSRQIEPYFSRIAFLFVGCFHPRDLVSDERVSPFNIAQRVRLPDFTIEQTKSLVNLLLPFTSNIDDIAAKIYFWTNGQPYLTQKICSLLTPSSSTEDVESICKKFWEEDENHFPHILKGIEKRAGASYLLTGILLQKAPKFFPLGNNLHAYLELLGVIRGNPDGICVFRNRMYEEVYREYVLTMLGFETNKERWSNEIEEIIAKNAPNFPYNTAIEIASLLRKAITNSPGNKFTDESRNSPSVIELITFLAGQELHTSSGILSFGSGNQLGDVTVRDIAGRDIVNITINYPAKSD